MKRFGWVVVSLFLVFISQRVSAFESEWITISSVEEFTNISSNKRYRLSEDLDFRGIAFNGLPALDNIVLDGNHKVLSNITIHSNQPYVGLFSVLTNSSVHNLRIESSDVLSTYVQAEGSFNHGTGSLVGLAVNSNVTDVVVSQSSVRAESEFVGGLIGKAKGLHLEKVYVHVEVQGSQQVGGVVGYLGKLDPFSEDEASSSSLLHQVMVYGQLMLDRAGAGLIGLVYLESLEISKVFMDVKIDAEGDVGMMLGELIEAQVRVSDVSANADLLTERYQRAMGHPALIHSYVEDYERNLTLTLQRVLVRASWQHQNPSHPYDPYLHTFIEGDPEIEATPITLNDVYYLERMLNINQIGSSFEYQLKDIMYLSAFDFNHIWRIQPHLNEGYPYLDFQEGHMTYHIDQSTRIARPFIKTQLIELIENPTRDSFRFDGWYWDEGLTQSFNPNLRYYEDKQVFAKWTLIPTESNQSNSISITVTMPESEDTTIQKQTPPSRASLTETKDIEETSDDVVQVENIEINVLEPELEPNASNPTQGRGISWWWLWLVLLIISLAIHWVINHLERRPKPRT